MVLASVNGKIAHNSASISVNDRGFLFGESVYEVISLYHKKPFNLEAHLERLEKGFQCFSNKPLPMDSIKKWVYRYIHKLPFKDFDNIYIQVSTGPMQIRDHRPDHTLQPTVIIQQTWMEPLDVERYKKGFSATCTLDNRSSFSGFKTNHLAHNTEALRHSIETGFDTGLFVKNNCVTEGVSSNFFAVKSGILITPPTQNILPGITRQTILALADKHNIPYEINTIPLSKLASLDEAFISSTTKLLQPLIKIDNLFEKETPGPLWLKLFNLYQDAMHEACQDPVTTSS